MAFRKCEGQLLGYGRLHDRPCAAAHTELLRVCALLFAAVVTSSANLQAHLHLPNSRAAPTAFEGTVFPDGTASSKRAQQCRIFYAPKITAKLALDGDLARQNSISSGGAAKRAVDGKRNGNWASGSVTHTSGQGESWWRIDLKRPYDIHEILVWGRTDCCWSRLRSASIKVSNVDKAKTGTEIVRSGGAAWGSRSSPVVARVPLETVVVSRV